MTDSFTIKRSIMIVAPADRIYPLIEDFHLWAGWSPWETIDADLQRNYSGEPKGLGAAYAWSGKKAGTGSMKIVEARPAALVGIALTFVKPFPAKNHIDFVLTPAGSGTQVDWIMTGPTTFMTKVMGLFMSMDKLVGKDFESGLARLKAVAEAG